ncbi:MAG: CBS domain-containing protein [Sulfolobus sp.]
MIVSDLIKRKVITARPDISIREASKIMKREGIGSLVIVNENFSPIGIITERDIVYAVADGIPLESKVAEIMSINPVTIDSNADISEALALMTSRGIRHLVVINKEGKVIGVISITDVIKAVGVIALDLAIW